MANFFNLFVFFKIISLSAVSSVSINQGSPSSSPEFSRQFYIHPRVLHTRERRQIHSSKTHEDSNEHISDISVEYELGDQKHVLDLRLNKELIPKNYFEKHQLSGSHVVNRPKAEEVELCHYNGILRGVPESWAALSTCDGLRGVIYDGQNMLFVEKEEEKSASLQNKHIVYFHSDLISNSSCGYNDNLHNHINKSIESRHPLRFKRNAERLIRGPYNVTPSSRFVELVLVVDYEGYNALNRNLKKTYEHCKDIANIINSLFLPLNLFVALTGVVVWSERDEISLSKNGDTTLTDFLEYRRKKLSKDHPNDNAQLLTKVQFENGVVGKALKGPICTYKFSGGVNMDHSAIVGVVATTVAHEMGHNLGMEHDTDECKCSTERCIMSPSSNPTYSSSPYEWSDCSKKYLAVAFGHGMDYCLRNKPEKLFDGAVCGNGFVEDGEECDCGLKERCDNPCCNHKTCTFSTNATCATGICCNLKTCQPYSAGTKCRESTHECDLPEYCDGKSEYCPDNVFKYNGLRCGKGISEAYCYDGDCRTQSDQCRLLWGPSGNSSIHQCYEQNTQGAKNGNCGENLQEESFIACKKADIECGVLHCQHYNERLEFGMESVSSLSHSYLNNNGKTVACRTVNVDLGLREKDPGLAPNGAKCGPKGEENMCVNQKCVPVANVTRSIPKICLEGCNGRGVCNNKGHCHCDDGFAPPFCDYPGLGGSPDSGPAADPNDWRVGKTLLYVLFLGVFPLVALSALFMFYLRNRHCWVKKPTVITSNIANEKNSRPPPERGQPNPDQNFGQSLLDSSSSQNYNGSDIAASLQNNLIGHLKGFKITPLQVKKCESSVTLVPTRPAPQPIIKTGVSNGNTQVVASIKTSGSHPTRVAPKTPSNVVPLSTLPQRNSSVPPALPPANSSQNEGRPLISSSGLASSFPAKELASVPTRSAPSRPLISSPILDSTTSSAAKELALVPTRSAPTMPAPQFQPNSTSNLLNEEKAKPHSQSTLTRIASFISRSPKAESPVVKAKLDRDTLRNIKISDPIPQSNIELPVKSLTVVCEKRPVLRAQSFRQNLEAKKRPNIPAFGSMRVPNSKRPTSIPACTRPTSPPPRPPPPIQGIPGYQEPSKAGNVYDDCLNLIGDEALPLANPADNIYAVIEESPTDRRERKEIILPTKKNIFNSSAEGTSAESSESLGLLDEIVSEIQARNSDSIYSSGTWKKYTDDDSISAVTDFSSASNDVEANQHLYANISSIKGTDETYSNLPKSSNSSTTSSGYLSPINSLNKPKTVSGKKKELSCDSKSNPIKIPADSAPSYKPFSSLRKDATLSAALGDDFNNSKSVSSGTGALAKPEVKRYFNSNVNPSVKSSGASSVFNVSNLTSKTAHVTNSANSIKTDPLNSATKSPVLPKTHLVSKVNSSLPNKSNSSQPDIKLSTPLNRVKLKSVESRNSNDSVNSNYASKPDIVSSCDIQKSSSTDRPPDVVNSKPDVNKKVTPGKQPLPAPKPVNIPPKKNISVNSSKNSKFNLAKKTPDKVNGKTHSVSNVASLQKKFESNVQ